VVDDPQFTRAPVSKIATKTESEHAVKLETVIAAVGSLSIFIAFITAPYTFGYFLYFDTTYMTFFSLTEYLTFSAGSIFTWLLLIGIYLSVSYVLRFFGREKPPKWFFKVADALTDRRSRLLIRPEANWIEILVTLAILVVVIVAFTALIVFARLDDIFAWSPFLFLVFAFFTYRVFTVPAALSYAAIFVSLELTLMSSGYLTGADAHRQKKAIEIVTSTKDDKEKPEGGFIIFLGERSVLLFDGDDMMFLKTLDGTTKARLGKIRKTSLPCIRVHLLDTIRGWFGYTGCRDEGPASAK